MLQCLVTSTKANALLLCTHLYIWNFGKTENALKCIGPIWEYLMIVLLSHKIRVRHIIDYKHSATWANCSPSLSNLSHLPLISGHSQHSLSLSQAPFTSCFYDFFPFVFESQLSLNSFIFISKKFVTSA